MKKQKNGKINDKTNVMRLLDAAHISYEVRSYEVDEHDLSGVHVADQLGQDPGSVFKTLVLKGEKRGYLVCVPPVSADAVADLCRFNLIIRFYRSDGADKRVFILYNNAPLVIVELLIVRCPQREDLLCYLYAAVRGPCEELCDPRVGRPVAVHRLCVRKR